MGRDRERERQGRRKRRKRGDKPAAPDASGQITKTLTPVRFDPAPAAWYAARLPDPERRGEP